MSVGLAGEKWLINPKSGDCNDYAVSKRHELLARGWPSRTLLLAEVVTTWGEHHLILVVRTGDGDFVLDNISPSVRLWLKVPYRWVRVQSPLNPKLWSLPGSTAVAELKHPADALNKRESRRRGKQDRDREILDADLAE